MAKAKSVDVETASVDPFRVISDFLLQVMPVGYTLERCPTQGWIVRNLNCPSADKKASGFCICDKCKFVDKDDPAVAFAKAHEAIEREVGRNGKH